MKREEELAVLVEVRDLLWPRLQGRFIRKLPQGEVRAIERKVAAAYERGVEIFRQEVQGYSKTGAPMIDCARLIVRIEALEGIIAAQSKLTAEHGPLLREYAQQMRSLAEMAEKVRLAAGENWQAFTRVFPVPSWPIGWEEKLEELGV